MMKKFCLIITACLLTVISALAQAPDVAMADQMRADGKIYVVVAVMGILYFGMLMYLLLLDNKISKVEKLVAEKKM